MTEEQIIELMAHPLAQRLVRKQVEEILHSVIMPRFEHRAEPVKRVKVAPIGMFTYQEAEEYLKMRIGTVRHYVFAKTLVGGKGLVSKISAEAYLKERANIVTRRKFIPAE